MTTPVAICLTVSPTYIDCSGCKQTYTDHGMRYRFESWDIDLNYHLIYIRQLIFVLLTIEVLLNDADDNTPCTQFL